jgi:hypothetical protein
MIQQPLLSNGSSNKHVSAATIALQQRSSIFFAVLAEIFISRTIQTMRQWNE